MFMYEVMVNYFDRCDNIYIENQRFLVLADSFKSAVEKMNDWVGEYDKITVELVGEDVMEIPNGMSLKELYDNHVW